MWDTLNILKRYLNILAMAVFIKHTVRVLRAINQLGETCTKILIHWTNLSFVLKVETTYIGLTCNSCHDWYVNRYRSNH